MSNFLFDYNLFTSLKFNCKLEMCSFTKFCSTCNNKKLCEKCRICSDREQSSLTLFNSKDIFNKIIKFFNDLGEHEKGTGRHLFLKIVIIFQMIFFLIQIYKFSILRFTTFFALFINFQKIHLR
jgi:hypothetical protein